MNMTGYAPAPLTNMAPQLNPQRSQIAALMGSRPGMPPTGQAMGMAPAAPQAMPSASPGMPAPAPQVVPLPFGNAQAAPMRGAAPMGQPPMGQAPAMSRPVMRMPQSMMR